MILGANFPIEIDSIDEGPWAIDGTKPGIRQPVLVLREATREEWVAELRAILGREPRGDWKYFYEVSTD